jgi:hypothetical protein
MVNWPDLLSGVSAITVAMSDRSYSKVFRIIVPAAPQPSSARAKEQQLPKEIDDEIADLLRSRYEEHIRGEGQKMRAKIETFKQTHMDSFKKVQAHGTEEELRMFILLKSMVVLDRDLKPASATTSPISVAPVRPTLPSSMKQSLLPALAMDGAGGKGGARKRESSGGDDQNDEGDLFDDEDDDATFAMEGFNSNSTGAVDHDDTESEDEEGDVIGRVVPTSPTSHTMLGSSLQRSSLPMDIPLSSSRGSLPRGLLAAPRPGSLADVGVGSPYSRDLPRGAVNVKSSSMNGASGSSLSTSFHAGSFKGPGSFVGSFKGEAAIRARLSSIDKQTRRRSNENSLSDNIEPGSPPK